jgi:hypothetical protein
MNSDNFEELKSSYSRGNEPDMDLAIECITYDAVGNCIRGRMMFLR